MIVYIDGENLVHQLLHVLIGHKRISSREELTHFDVVALCQALVGAPDLDIRYYSTRLRRVEGDQYDEELDQRAQAMISWGAAWSNNLRRQGIKVIKAGNLRMRDGVACRNCGHRVPFFEEKGVDVQMAVDIALDAKAGLTQFIMSSDSDLIPAIRAAKERGSRVKNLASQGARNKGLALTCGEWQTYTDKQLLTAFDSVNEAQHGN